MCIIFHILSHFQLHRAIFLINSMDDFETFISVLVNYILQNLAHSVTQNRYLVIVWPTSTETWGKMKLG